MRQVLGVVGAICLAAGFPRSAAAQERLPRNECGSELPYSTRMSNLGGEIQGKLTAVALEGLLRKVPVGTEGTIGGEYITATISSSAGEALSQVIEFYNCRSRNGVIDEVNAGRMTAAQLEAFDERADAIKSVIDTILEAAASGSSEDEAVEAVRAVSESEQLRVREFMGTPLDTAIRNQVTRAMRGTSPSDFTRLNRGIGWVRIQSQAVQIGGCGGVITNVLEGAHGDLQVTLSTTPTFYRMFFDRSAVPAVGQTRSLIRSFASLLRNAPPASSVPDMTPQFRACTRALLAELDPLAAEQLENEATATGNEAPSAATGQAVPGATTPNVQPLQQTPAAPSPTAPIAPVAPPQPPQGG